MEDINLIDELSEPTEDKKPNFETIDPFEVSPEDFTEEEKLEVLAPTPSLGDDDDDDDEKKEAPNREVLRTCGYENKPKYRLWYHDCKGIRLEGYSIRFGLVTFVN